MNFVNWKLETSWCTAAKLAIAKYDPQHARGVRSPERLLHRRSFGHSFAAHENISGNHPFVCELSARANAIAETPIHVRRHDEPQARRRAGAVAGWQMGCVGLRRCRSDGEQEDFAFMDCALQRR